MIKPLSQLEVLQNQEQILKDKIERIPKTFSKETQAEALERAKAGVAEVQAAIRDLKKDQPNDKKPAK